MVEFGRHLRELNPIPETLREKWRQNEMVPLWETEKNIFGPPLEQPRHWQWSVMRPILLETSEITDPAIIERRVLQLVNPTVDADGGDAAAGLMNAAVQALRAGEHAPPHRHSINALRLILEGNAAQTIVNGRVCQMTPGDLVLTPAWTWHEHRHEGGPVSMWLDILDGNLLRLLGQAKFQPGPVVGSVDAGDEPNVSNSAIEPVVPDGESGAVFRYPWSEAKRVLGMAPMDADGARRAKYVNPATRGPCLSLIDCWLLQLEAGLQTAPSSTPADTIISVIEGEGTSIIGDKTIHWHEKDTFTIPRQSISSHRGSTLSRLFIASNHEVYKRLGLIKSVDGTRD